MELLNQKALQLKNSQNKRGLFIIIPFGLPKMGSPFLFVVKLLWLKIKRICIFVDYLILKP